MARRLNPNTSGDDVGLYKGDTSAGRTPADSSVETSVAAPPVMIETVLSLAS